MESLNNTPPNPPVVDYHQVKRDYLRLIELLAERVVAAWRRPDYQDRPRRSK